MRYWLVVDRAVFGGFSIGDLLLFALIAAAFGVLLGLSLSKKTAVTVGLISLGIWLFCRAIMMCSTYFGWKSYAVEIFSLEAGSAALGFGLGCLITGFMKRDKPGGEEEKTEN